MNEHERALTKELLAKRISHTNRLTILYLIDQNRGTPGLSDGDLDLLHGIATETRRSQNIHRFVPAEAKP